ncbi:MAG: threonine/serine dehydratase [Betaproteobacteria bacterium]|nr:MAG: threonine/serine dehydratase [Betaproteobacteria bacterium]
MLIERERIEEASQTVHQWLAPTPLIRSDYLSQKLDANVWLKLETLQPTHSFKVRGAFNAIAKLNDAQRKRGVVTASGGNHGLAVAYAARTSGIAATVLLPEKTQEVRIRAIRSQQARLLLHGASWDDANIEAQRIARTQGMSYIHPFDDEHVMAGQGTIVPELLKQIPRVDVLVASIGGGGLLSGLISAASAAMPEARVFGVETEGADSMYQSWRAGRIVELPAITSIAETLGARKTEQRQFNIITGNASALVTVSDAEAIAALVELLSEEKLLTEPATSCSIAALLCGKVPLAREENVVVVLCGANVGIGRVAQWISKGTETD